MGERSSRFGSASYRIFSPRRNGTYVDVNVDDFPAGHERISSRLSLLVLHSVGYCEVHGHQAFVVEFEAHLQPS